MTNTTMLAAALVGIGYFGTLLGAWLFRQRWAGSLVASMRDPRYPRELFLLPAILFVWVHFGDGLGPYRNAVVLTLLAVLYTYVWVVVPNLEMRDRGILYRGRLISWLNIERYDWEPSIPGEPVVLSLRPQRAVLRLHVTRRFPFLPSPRIPIPQGNREELEMILNRHLSTWPE